MNVVYSDQGYDALFKNSVAERCSNMDESHRHYVEQRSQTEKILFDSIYINFQNRQS